MSNTNHAFLFNPKSSNAKTGKIPVTTTSQESCPESCAFMNNGCYAESGPLGMLWRKMSNAGPNAAFDNGRAKMQTIDFDQLIASVESIPAGQLWRHNQAGDLMGQNMTIDRQALIRLAKANAGKRGFTYTHKPPMGKNIEAIREANRLGFTVNVSANSAAHAAKLKAANPDLPIVCVLPIEAETQRYVEKDGLKITVCPATRKDATGKEVLPDMTCEKCGLCQVANRLAAVGFPAHGTSKKKAAAIAA